MKISLPTSLIVLAATSLSLQCASAITVSEQLEAWKKEIELEKLHIGEQYRLKPARINQQKAFESGGVGWAQRYSEAWGGWIYMDWSTASNLHTRLIHTIQTSLVANRPSAPISEASMNQHSNSMRDFRWRNGKIRRLLQARIQLNVHRGLELDKAHDAHLAYLAATIVKNTVMANAMKLKEEYHKKQADEWARIGGRTSTLIRQLGATTPTDAAKFATSYNELLGLAKSGELPDVSVVNSGSER
ncbi:hypothetical protein NT6N_29180 [Oceaniferula spumae]|uniref:Uncharacterized protein n=1 Tax=Oceaniferula spumae TaxID=2979115 RepID=A0AAT9FPI7_9BACT